MEALVVYNFACKNCAWNVSGNLPAVTQAQYDHLKTTGHNVYEMRVFLQPDPE